MSSLITLAEAKQACDVTNTARDVFLQDIIDGTEHWAQEYLGRSFARSAAVVDYLDGGGHALWPRTRPVVSVSEVYDTESGESVDTDDYDLVDDGIVRAARDRWEDIPPNRWRVTYAGGDDGLLDGVKMALLMFICRVWTNPEALTRQSAGGYGSGFQMLPDSDILFALEMYRSGGGTFG